MELSPWLLGSALFLGYFIESVFGFAGTIIWLSILSFFVDIKLLIFLTVMANIWANTLVLITGKRHIVWKKFFRLAIPALPGLFVGAALVDALSSALLLKVFAVFLVGFALYSLFLPRIQLQSVLQKITLFFSGLLQGIFGTGGPLLLIAMQSSFTHKSEIRSTLALFFLSFNILRAIQYGVQGTFSVSQYAAFWWILPIIFVAVLSGYYIHVAIPETLFKKGIALLLLFSGFFLFFQ